MLRGLWQRGTPLARLLMLIFAAQAALFVAVIVASYRWEYEHDTPLLQYAGFLMSKFGMVPYRDFFETSMPGVFFFHAAIVRFFGTGNLAFILVTHAFLAILLFVSWSTMAKIDEFAASAFVIWFGLFYLAGGPSVILQRDGLGLLPIMCAFCIVVRRIPQSRALRAVLIGVLSGIAALVKPHLAIGGAIVLLVDLCIDDRPPEESTLLTFGRAMVLAGVGFAVPTGLTAMWLWRNDALGPFVEFVTKYLPLHVQQDTDHVFRVPSERFRYVLTRGVHLADNWPFIPSLVVGVAFAFSRYFEAGKRRLAIGLAILTLYYAGYPMLTGQFWAYHFMPFFFFFLMTLSLLVGPILEAKSISGTTATYFLALTVAVLGTLGKDFQHPVFAANKAQNGIVGRMEPALAAVWTPGQTIQPIDWTNGTIHAMLRLGARIGTPFFYDYHFHHNVSNPFIQELRARYITAFTVNRPDVVIRAAQYPRPSGVDTDRAFPELDAILQSNYCAVTQDPDFTIYKRCR
jgi:hypothetical protein